MGVCFVFSPLKCWGFGWKAACLWQLGQGFHVGVEVASLAINLARGWVI